MPWVIVYNNQSWKTNKTHWCSGNQSIKQDTAVIGLGPVCRLINNNRDRSSSVVDCSNCHWLQDVYVLLDQYASSQDLKQFTVSAVTTNMLGL